MKMFFLLSATAVLTFLPLAGKADDSLLCLKEAVRLEKKEKIQPNLLSAIALVESGLYFKQYPTGISWPWTVTAEGKGTFYDSKDLFFAIIGVLFSRQLVTFMGAQEEHVLIAGTQYLQIQMVGMFTVSLTTSITNSLRGSGDSKTAMFYNTTANVVNVCFNYLLIYGKF
ncbi:MAG: hypothetical protein IKR09_04665, partial [Alphaproteobacteria bacterium]|nr:hypothetical protein [Alphaproteobacteria bacterium]